MNPALPRWSGPFVGAVLGTLLALQGASGIEARIREGDDVLERLIGGAGLGFLAGIVIWLLDPPPRPGPFIWTRESGIVQTESDATAAGSLVGRVLALVSILLFCLPPLGLGLGIAAVVMNRRVVGWPRTVSWIAMSLSVILSIAFVIVLVLAPGG
jgi:hypothetical protein